MSALRILPFGDRGVLIEVDTLAEVLALHARLAAGRPAGVVDLVPAARTVLVHVDPRRLSLAATRAWIARGGDAPTSEASDARVVEVPIVYDGPDLVALAAQLGTTAAALAARHAACAWTVAFTGFAPGFAYLASDEWPYDVPRLESPRTRVPAGAVGLAGAFSGAYPRDTPGGWRLIGTTSAPLFTPDAPAPALLTPGTHVRFTPAPAPPAATPARLHLRRETAVATRSLAAQTQSRGERAGGEREGSERAGGEREVGMVVRAVGALATVQDLGRPGRAVEGIAVSGAADRAALRTANRLVGNAEDAAGIEITLGGFRAVAARDLWVAVAGAWGPLRIDGRAVDPYTACRLPQGAELDVGAFAHGARGYLAVRGGLDARRVAGSCATDTMSGLGPAPLRAGDGLATAGASVAPIPVDELHPWGPPPDALLEIDLAPGPRADWIADTGALHAAEWTVSPRADRVGIRLAGPALTRTRAGELPSEGMLPGAVQVPPDGLPVILGPDGPVTGGYPVVAVVTDASRDALAQARPGTRIRFRHAH